MLLGLDYGDKNIGVAVSINNIAIGLMTIRREHSEAFKPIFKELKPIIARYAIKGFVLGMPLNLNGEYGTRAKNTMYFKEKLEKYFKYPVHLWDERLSTKAVLRTSPIKYKTITKRACSFGSVDEMAAVYILQGFLDAEKKS